MNIDSHTVSIPCPGCGEKIEETLGRLKDDAHLVCTSCGQKVFVDAEKFRAGIAAAEKAMDEFRRTLGKLGK